MSVEIYALLLPLLNVELIDLIDSLSYNSQLLCWAWTYCKWSLKFLSI